MDGPDENDRSTYRSAVTNALGEPLSNGERMSMVGSSLLSVAIFNPGLATSLGTGQLPLTDIVASSTISQVPAQVGLDAASQAVCGNESAQALAGLIEIAFGLLAAYFLLKAIGRGSMGVDKKGSSNEQTQREGGQQILGGGASAAAAFMPGLIVAIMEAAGVGLVACLTPGAGGGGGSGAAMVALDVAVHIATIAL